MFMQTDPHVAPTLTQIGRLCGLNKSTVYRALTGSGRVSPETVEKVRAIATQLGYDPARNRAAQRLAARRADAGAGAFRNHAIALFLVKGFHRFAYYHRIHAGTLNALAELDYDLLTVQFDVESPRMPRMVLAGEVDAIISIVELGKVAQALGPSSLPLVGVIRSVPGCAAVVSDQCDAAYQAAKLLLEQGHRRLFHFFSLDATEPAPQRIKGYRQAARDHGLSPDKTILGLTMPNDLPHPRWLARHLSLGLDRYPDITGILAPNDEDARVIYDALTARGLRVPQDMSLVGCDDVAPICDARGENILSTVDLSLYDVGQAAARLTVDILEGRARRDARLTLPVKPVLRSSIAPAPR